MSADLFVDLTSDFESVKITQLDFLNADVSFTASAKVFDLNEEVKLNLATHIYDGDASQTKKYLPTGIMDEELVEYLDDSILSGKLDNATGLVRGALKEFPFVDSTGVFSIHASVTNAENKYLPDWPKATEVDAELFFNDDDMKIVASSGFALGNRLNQGVVSIKDMLEENSTLEIELSAKSKNNAGKQFLAQSPLNFIAEGIELMDISGELLSEVKINIPLTSEDIDISDISLEGSVSPSNDNLAVTLPFLKSERIKGTLFFNQQGIQLSEFAGLVDGNLITANVQTVDSAVKSASGLETLASQPSSFNNEFLKIDFKGVFASKSIDQFIDGNWSEFFRRKD